MKKISKNLICALNYAEQNPTMSLTQIANQFNVERHALSRWLTATQSYKNYIYNNKKDPNDNMMYYFSDAELEMLNYYKEHKNITHSQLCKDRVNAPKKHQTLYHWLNIMGYEIYDTTIKYHYNRQKFNEINTEEDAYWLGFITADGCIIENKWLAIQLGEVDYNHLVKFCQYMEFPEEEIPMIIQKSYGGAYDKNNTVYFVKICSLEIIKNLMDKGIVARKSGKEIPYICKTKELELAYIRGLIDGDGYLRSTQYGMGIVGSYAICEYIRNYLIANVHDLSKNNIHQHGAIWKFAFSGFNNCSIVTKALYENATIFLDRKYNLYKTQYCRD